MVLIPCSAGDAHLSRELLCLDIVTPLLSRKMDKIRFKRTSCHLTVIPAATGWLKARFPIHGSINLTGFFFLLLILGIHIIRDMQGF